MSIDQSAIASRPSKSLFDDYLIIDEQDGMVDVGAEFNGGAIERIVTRYARDLATEAPSHAHSFLRSNSSLLSELDNFDDVMKLALQEAADRLVGEVAEELKIIPLDDPYVRFLEGDLSDSISIMVTIPVLRCDAPVNGDQLEVEYHPVIGSGDEVDDRIEEACSQFNVGSPEELIEKTDLYESVDQMRAELAVSLSTYIEELEKRSIDEAACDALLKANPFEVPEKLLDGYVDREMQGIISGMGEDALSEQLCSQGMTLEGFRGDMASDLMDALRLEIILDALALQIDIGTVEDGDRLIKIKKKMGDEGIGARSRDEMAIEVLKDIKANPSRLRSLDKDIRRDRALDHVVEASKLTALAPMTASEFVRFDKVNMPRM